MAGEPHLADTNILLRLVRRDEPEYGVVRRALEALRQQGTPLFYTSQNLVEFWNVATRPKDRNGFGLSPVEADHEASVIEAALNLLPDVERIHREWRRLVVMYGISGVQVHDARIVAAMLAHGIRRLLTLNDRDFARYSAITVVHPSQLAPP